MRIRRVSQSILINKSFQTKRYVRTKGVSPTNKQTNTKTNTNIISPTLFFRNASDNSWGARCSRRQGNFFPLTTHTGGVGCVLALGPEVARRPRLRCLETALDPVPFSMTIALLASSRGSCIPRPEMLLSLISVVLVLLVGELGVKLSSRSSLWT